MRCRPGCCVPSAARQSPPPVSFPTNVTSRRSRVSSSSGMRRAVARADRSAAGAGSGVRAERPGRDDASHAVEAFDHVVPQGPGDPYSMNEDDRRAVTGDA